MASQYGVEDIITSLAITGLDDFELQESSDDTNSRFADRTNRLADVLEEQEIDPRIDYNIGLVIKSVPITGAELILGGVGYGEEGSRFVLTALRVSQIAEEFALLNLVGHVHTGASVGEHIGSAYTIALPTLDEGVASCFSINGTLNEDIARVEFSASVNHTDKYSRNTGVMIIGRSMRCKLEERVTLFQNATLSAATGWKRDSKAGNGSNMVYKGNLWVAHKYQAPDVVEP